MVLAAVKPAANAKKPEANKDQEKPTPPPDLSGSGSCPFAAMGMKLNLYPESGEIQLPG